MPFIRSGQGLPQPTLIAPAFLVAPVVNGTPTAGVATTYTSGQYIGFPPPALTRQWLLDGVAIAGAVGATYTPTAGDVGHGLSIRETITNNVGTASATSASVSVQSAAGTAPVFTSAPSIIGTPTVGFTSSYTPGVVTGNPTPTITRQWLRDGVAITGATGTTYTPVVGDAGHVLAIRETATNTAGSASSTSGGLTVAATAPTSTGLYRNNQPYLFATIQQANVPVPAAFVGQPGALPFNLDGLGCSRTYVERERGWAWTNPGGDWIDRNLVRMGTAAWVVAFTGANPDPTTYTFDCTLGLQRVQTANRWNAWIVKKATTTPRVMCGKFHPDPAKRPRMEVIYVGDSTPTVLSCRCTYQLSTSSITPTQSAPTQSLSTNWSWAVEFVRPDRAVQSASLIFTVAEHWGGSDTLQWNLADPPLNANPVGSGIAAGFTLDSGMNTHPSIIFHHRYQDGSVNSDWCLTDGLPPLDSSREDAFSPEFWGGPVDTTRLPYRGLGKWLVGVNTEAPSEFGLVPSTYTADPGFFPLAPGLGAIRMTMPKDYSIEGGAPGVPIQDGDHLRRAGTLAVDSRMFMPADKLGLISEIWSRCYIMVPNPAVALLDDLKLCFGSSGPMVWTSSIGKLAIPVPCHQTPFGGNSNQGGGGLGWSNRFEWGDMNADVSNPNPLNNAYGLALSWVDFQRTSATLSGGAANPKYPYTQPIGFTYGPDEPSTKELGQQGGLGSHIYAGNWYCVEIHIKLNSLTTFQPTDVPGPEWPGPRPTDDRFWDADGVYEIFLDGRLVMQKTGMVFRSIPVYPIEDTGAANQRRPCRELGILMMWANWYNGGVNASNRAHTMYMTGYAVGTQRIGPMTMAAAPVAPAFTSPPTINGTPQVGVVTTYVAGTVTGNPTPTVTRQWLRDGVAIAGATQTTYTPVTADAGHQLAIRETATNTAGSATSTSASKTISAGLSAPAFTTAPSIIGTPTVGFTTSYTPGTVTGNPTPTITRQWLLDGLAITGATQATYIPVSGDAGHTLSIRETATNSVGVATSTSAGLTVAAVSNLALLPSRPGHEYSVQIPGPANWLDTSLFPAPEPWSVYDTGADNPISFARSMQGVQTTMWRKVHPWGMPSDLYGRTPIVVNGRIASEYPRLGNNPDYIKAVTLASPELLVQGPRGRSAIHPYFTWDSHTYTLPNGTPSTSVNVPMWIGIGWNGECGFLLRDGSFMVAFTFPITTWAQDWTSPINQFMYATDSGAGTLIEADRNTNPMTFTTRVTGLGVVTSVRAILGTNFLYAADSVSGTVWKIDRTTWTKTPLCVLPRVFCLRHTSNGNFLVAYTLNNTVHKIDVNTGSVGADILVGVLKDLKEWVWLAVDRNGTCGLQDAIYCITSIGAGNNDLWRINPDGTVVGRAHSTFIHDIGPEQIGHGTDMFEAAGHYPWVVSVHENDAAMIVQGFSQNLPVLLLAKNPSLVWPNEGTASLFYHGQGQDIVTYGVGASLPIGSKPSLTCEMNYSGGSGFCVDSDHIASMALASIPNAVDYIRSGMTGQVRRDYLSGEEMKALMYYLCRNSQTFLIQGKPFIDSILAFNYGPTPPLITTLNTNNGRRADRPDAFADLFLEVRLTGSTLQVWGAQPATQVALPAGLVCDIVIDAGRPAQVTIPGLVSPWMATLPALSGGPHSLLVSNISGTTLRSWGRASLIEVGGTSPPPPPPPPPVAVPPYVPTVENTISTLTVANGKLANNLIDVAAPYYQETTFFNIRNGDSGPALNPYWGPYGGYMLYGCGHASTNDNTCAVLEFGATQARFKRLTDPTPLFGSGTDETTQMANSNTATVDRDFDIGEYLLDRQPWSAHTYGSGDVVGPEHGGAACGTYLAVAKVAGGQGGNGPSGGSVLTPHKVDMATTTGATGSYAWQRIAGYTGGGNITILSPQPCWTAFVPAQNRIYFESHYATAARPPRWYDRSSNTIVVGTGTSRSNSNLFFWGCRLLHVPERDLLIFAWSTNNTQEIRIVTMSVGVADTNPSWNNTPRTLSQTLLVPQGWSHICWCTQSQRLIVGASTPTPNSSTSFDTIYEIAIPVDLNSTWTVEAVPLPAGVTLPIMNQGPALGTPCYKGWDYCVPIKAIAYYPIAATNNTVPTPYADSLFFYKPRGTT